MLGEHTTESVPKIFEKVPAVGNLDGLGCALCRPFSIGARSITGNNLDSWMIAQPRSERVRGSIG